MFMGISAGSVSYNCSSAVLLSLLPDDDRDPPVISGVVSSLIANEKAESPPLECFLVGFRGDVSATCFFDDPGRSSIPGAVSELIANL